MAVIHDGTFTELTSLLAGGGEGAERAARTLRDMSLEGPVARDAALRLGAVPKLLPYLRPNNPPQILTLLAQAVSYWCRRADDAPAVQLPLVAPALPLLKDLLLHGDSDVLEAVCAAMINLTHGSGAHTGALQAVPELTAHLVALLDQETDARVTRGALCAVANMLAGTRTQVERCLDAGVLDYIVPLLRSSDSFLVEHAARGTANIFTHACFIKQALDYGVLAPLPNILDSGDDACRQQVVKAICSFCCCYGTAAQRSRLVSSGVLQSYCAVLARPDHTLAALVLAGLNALVQAAEIDDESKGSDPVYSDSKDSNKDHEVNPLFMELSKTNLLDSIEKIVQTQDIDENLCRQAQELSVAVRWYALGKFLILEDEKVYSPTEIVREMKSGDLLRKLGAARAARRMLIKAEKLGRMYYISDVLMWKGISPPLIAALNKDICSDLQHEAAWILSRITQVRKHSKAVEKRGAIPKLVALLANKGQVAAQAAYTLGNISLNGVWSRDKVLKSGAMGFMLPYMRPETPLSRLRAYMRSYDHLSYYHYKSKKTPDILAQISSALVYIPKLLAIDDQEVLQLSCLALSRMMYSSDEVVIDTVQAVPELTECLLALLSHKAVEVQGPALLTMSNMLSGTYDQVERCLDAGCVELITPFLRSRVSSLVVDAASAIVNIVRNPVFIERVLEQDVLAPLLDILDNGELKCQVQAAWAINDLCSCGTTEQRAQVVSRGVVQRCSALLAARDTTPAAEPPAGRDDLAQKLIFEVCEILQGVMLAHENIEAVQAIPGLTARLVALLGHKEPKVQLASLLIVKKMLEGTETQMECCLNAGCLEHMTLLLRHSDSFIKQKAACVVGIILDRFIERTLGQDLLTPLLEVLDHEEFECQVQAAWAISNLCSSGTTAQRAEVVSRGVVERCNALLAASDTTPAAEPPAGQDDLTQTSFIRVLCEILQSVMLAHENIKAVQVVPGLTARLVALMAHNAAEVQGASLKAVKTMLDGTESQVKRCIEVGCLDHITPLLRHSDSVIVEDAAYAVGSILNHAHFVERVLGKDILTPLLEVLDHEIVECQLQAARAISNFCFKGTQAQREQVALRGVVHHCNEQLVAVWDTTPAEEPPANQDDPAQVFTIEICRVLQGVMYTSRPLVPEVAAVRDVEATPDLTTRVVALLGHESTKVQAAALGTLTSFLNGSETLVDRCLAAGCLKYISRILQSTDPALVEEAARVTGYFFGYSQLIQHALDEDVLTLLLEILTHEELKCRIEAVYAIGNLCVRGSAAQRELVLSRGVLRPFCEQLATPGLTVQALQNILDGLDCLLQVKHHEFNGKVLRSQLRELGLRTHIDKLSKHGDSAVKEKALELLDKYSVF